MKFAKKKIFNLLIACFALSMFSLMIGAKYASIGLFLFEAVLLIVYIEYTE